MGTTDQPKQAKEMPDFKDVENGPMDESNRQCRDVFCCILFIANICAMIYVTVHAYTTGDPNKIFRGVAGDGVICGEVGGKAELYPYVYFYHPTSSIDKRVCVTKCPVYENSALPAVNCYPDHNIACVYDLILTQDGAEPTENALENQDIKFVGYDTTLTIDRICMPSVAVLQNAFKSIIDTMSQSLQSGTFANISEDVNNNWMWLLCGVGIALVVSLIFMFLLRCLVGCIVWVSSIGIILIFIALGVIFLYNGGALGDEHVGFLGLPKLQGSEYYNTYGYISFAIAGVLLILLLCCCSRLRLAVAVCKVAGQFVIRVCQVSLVPIVLSLLLIMVWGACLIVLVYLLSATDFFAYKSVTGSYDILTSVKDYADNDLLMLYYFLFALLWTNALIQAIGIFIIASCCCMWYYKHGPEDVLDSPVSRSFVMSLRYHFGSLAFGSFILAVVQFLQAMVEAFKKQAQNSGADQNKCFEYAINCLRCCLACVQRIVQFINKTAYIQIALRGKNFCMAAKDGFEIVWGNGLRYLVVGGVGAIIMFVGKVMISVGSTAAFYCIITFIPSVKAGILEPLYLLLIVFLISFGIATLFISIYSLAIDTILACFIVDEMNQQAKGSSGVLYGPEELQVLIDDSNKD